jgi:hypothetical protein
VTSHINLETQAISFRHCFSFFISWSMKHWT